MARCSRFSPLNISRLILTDIVYLPLTICQVDSFPTCAFTLGPEHTDLGISPAPALIGPAAVPSSGSGALPASNPVPIPGRARVRFQDVEAPGAPAAPPPHSLMTASEPARGRMSRLGSCRTDTRVEGPAELLRRRIGQGGLAVEHALEPLPSRPAQDRRPSRGSGASPVGLGLASGAARGPIARFAQLFSRSMRTRRKSKVVPMTDDSYTPESPGPLRTSDPTLVLDHDAPRSPIQGLGIGLDLQPPSPIDIGLLPRKSLFRGGDSSAHGGHASGFFPRALDPTWSTSDPSGWAAASSGGPGGASPDLSNLLLALDRVSSNGLVMRARRDTGHGLLPAGKSTLTRKSGILNARGRHASPSRGGLLREPSLPWGLKSKVIRASGSQRHLSFARGQPPALHLDTGASDVGLGLNGNVHVAPGTGPLVSQPSKTMNVDGQLQRRSMRPAGVLSHAQELQLHRIDLAELHARASPFANSNELGHKPESEFAGPYRKAQGLSMSEPGAEGARSSAGSDEDPPCHLRAGARGSHEESDRRDRTRSSSRGFKDRIAAFFNHRRKSRLRKSNSQ